MFGLKSVYFYFIATQITLVKFFKKLYFSSKNYNKSLETKTPQQVYYNPNPFLLSIITPYRNKSFKINEIDPNIFWLESFMSSKYAESITVCANKSFENLYLNSEQSTPIIFA